MEKVIYIRTPFTDHGGATVRIFAENLGADAVCEVQVTHCSQKTPFSRREGRKFVLEKTPVKMQVSELPKKMRRISRRVLKLSGVKHGDNWLPDSPIRTMYENDWSWVMQAFMPKLSADYNAGLIRRVPRAEAQEAPAPAVVQAQQPIEPRGGGGSGNDRMMMLIGDPGVF